MSDARVCGRGGSLGERKAKLEEKSIKQQQPGQGQGQGQGQPFALRHAPTIAEKKHQFAAAAASKEVKQVKMDRNTLKTPAKTVDKSDPNYGRPVPGSKSEGRGKNAAKRVNAEVVFLCEMVHNEGMALPDGTAVITFGELFQLYTRISNKLVGMLLRARKYHLLTFEGETLFQRRDDHVPVRLLRPIQDIRAELNQDVEFDVGVCHRTGQ